MTTRRRTLHLLAAASLAGVSGCLGGDDSEPSDPTPGGPPEKTSEAGSEGTAEPTEASLEATDASGKRSDGDLTTVSDGMSAQVELSTKSHRMSATPPETYFLEPTDPEPLSAFPEPLADALRQAHGDGFTTDDPSDALLAAIDERRNAGSNHRLSELPVRIDGTDYVATVGLPELEVRLTDELLDEYEADRVAALDDEFQHDEVEHLVERIGWDGTPNRARVPYRLSLVPDAVETFLDTYDYVEDYKGVSPITVERHSWEPPYTIQLREFTAEDRWSREVLDVETLDEELRGFLQEVVDAEAGVLSPPYLTDTVPEAYVETIQTAEADGERPFVMVAGTVYHVKVVEGTHEETPVEMTTALAPPREDGLARFNLTVTVTADKPDVEVAASEPVELHGNVGLPSALWVALDGEYHLLKSERYELDVVSEDGGGSWSLAANDLDLGETAVTESLSVGEQLAATYIVPEHIPAGSYTLAGNFAALWQEDSDDVGQADGVYPFAVELTLGET